MTPGNFTVADIERYAAFGISVELLIRAHVRRVTDAEARALLAINGRASLDLSGIEYPYRDPVTGHRVTSRVRLDRPPLRPDGKAEGKYRSGYGDRKHLFFAPGSGPLLDDPTVPIVFVESEKASLTLTALSERAGSPLLAIATGGCWGWRGVSGKQEGTDGARAEERGPVADLSRIVWTNRDVRILFDARPNESVRAARRALANELERRGAHARHVHLPDTDPAVNGPDDFLAEHGDAATLSLLASGMDHDFERTDNGAIIRASLNNIRRALRLHGMTPSFDAFAGQVLINGHPFDDLALDQLWVAIDDRFHFRPPKEVLQTIVATEAHAQATHPVRDYLAGLTWDGVPRLDRWLATYGGADDDNPYVSAVAALVLIAAVRRVRQPGCKFDELLILESNQQGTWKSSALRALTPRDDWFSDDLPLGADTKQVIERTAGRWLIEASELHGHRGRESETLKGFLSRQVDGPVRLAYARLPVSVPRQFVIVGTTNNTVHYLKDPTGSRRFWPVTIRGFDLPALADDRDQLWAEAAARETEGVSIRLDPALWAIAREEQDQRYAADPWEELLEPLTQDGLTIADTITSERIWNVLGVDADSRDNRQADRVAAIMQRFGYTRERRRLAAADGRKQQVRCWVRQAT